jgi:hypothetical protein
MRDRLAGIVDDCEMRADNARRRRSVFYLNSDQPLRRPNRHVVRYGLALAVGVAVFEFRVHLNRGRRARYVADFGARAAGAIEREILALMHARILLGLTAFLESLVAHCSRLDVAVGENVIVEVGKLRVAFLLI